MSKKTLVLGASTNPSRYAFLAANRLKNAGHDLVLLGNKKGEVAGEKILHQFEALPKDIDTVSLYLNPQNQEPYKEDIVKLKPKRVIFNPGTENPEFENTLQEAGIETLEACTLVLLSTGQF